MNDEVKMDASGCWVWKNAQVIRETLLPSHGGYYGSVAYSLDARNTADDDKQDEALLTW